MTDDLREAVHHLLWVWFQYGRGLARTDGKIRLSHKCMGAGEEAADFLEALGLGEDDGYYFVLNEEGEKIMNEAFV